MTTDFVIITKEMKHVMGVYGIRRISGGLFYYIGSSLDVWRRWIAHKRKNISDNASEEYKVFHKLLIDNLDDFEPVLLYKLSNLIHVTNKQRLHHRLVKHEKQLISEYIAAGHPIATKPEYQDGTYERKDETKTKMSASHTGKHLSEEHKSKISASGKIAKNRPEAKAKTSASGKIAQNRPEVRAKKSASMKGKNAGENSANLGTKWMHKPNETAIMVKECDIETKKKEGYIFGRKSRKKSA